MKLFNTIGAIFKKKELSEDFAPSLIGEPKPLFLCDRLACKNCSYPLCKHTDNIAHAKNFDLRAANLYMEREPSEDVVKIFPDLEVIYE